MEIRLAKNVDAENIKNMINEMYGLEYEIWKLNLNKKIWKNNSFRVVFH